MPDNAPAPGACVRVERPEPALAIVIFDPPHRSFPVFDAPMVRDLREVIRGLAKEEGLRGVVFTGRKPDQFLAGADVEGIGSITDPQVFQKACYELHEVFDAIANLKARTVAAVSGPVPGGAYEISLACDRIVASDSKATRIGLPETQLGIIPGWGGSHRLPRRIGVPAALNAALTGRLFPAKSALKQGMIDRVTKQEYLLRIASDIAMGRMPCKARGRGYKALLVDRNPLALWIVGAMARKGVTAKTRGKYPAPYEAIKLILGAPMSSQGSWARKEAEAVGRLGVTSECKALVSLFFGTEQAKALGKHPDGTKVDPIETAVVVGAGIMGGGIASVMAQRGVSVRLADLSSEALGNSLAAHAKALKIKKKRRQMTVNEHDMALDRLDAVPGIIGVSGADFAIEAVAEVLGVKQKVLGALAEAMGEHAILATNTSSLSVDAIAASLPHPERVIGMHFFNPVPKMPLVEIIRGSQTSDEVVIRTTALALRMGKTPVICKDVPGFLVNRLLGPYLDEAVRLFLGGVDPERLDGLMLDFGMPMGPLQLLDEVGIDIASHAAASLHEGYGERMTPAEGLANFVEGDRLGKKSGLGFYNHRGVKKGKKAELAPDLTQFQTPSFVANLGDKDLVDRMVLAMFNEGCRALEEGVVSDANTLDLATVFGMGFAPFHGGLLSYGEARGLTEIRDRLDALTKAPDIAGRPGGKLRFTPAAILVDAAANDGKLR
ncbi:MAG: 3-hydroxyacyl-CoA dehydrogenase/enoyl-CoA hydratase/3-hydroxybutyryl-CoA epimerase [Planctomycetota bacterium]|jgi:3-hydroxyacyl-CoA dehydrogenase/enoyl-CoA hydratase/3-hydroxybutyryl-CoA epimerase